MEKNPQNYFSGISGEVETVISENRKAKAKLFRTIAILIIALAVIVSIIVRVSGNVVISTFCFLLSAYSTPFIVLYFKFRDGKVSKVIPMSGKEYDNLVIGMIKSKQHDAREYLGLDTTEVEEIAPISFDGYDFAKCTKCKKDKDDAIWRTNIYEKVTIFFTQNELHVYKCFLNTIDETITETTSVYFYEDVVSVSTSQEKYSNPDLKVDLEYISFVLETRGSSKISVALKGDISDHQRSVNAMRAMIKEKKAR